MENRATGYPAITTAHIERYRRDGAVLIKGVLDPDRLRLLKTGIEEAFQSERRRATQVDAPKDQGETIVLEYVTQDSPSLGALLDSGIIGNIAARLMEVPSAQLILDQVFHKQQGPILPTPWHQDTPFLRVRGDDFVRLWFPCDFSPRDLTVQVARGSHRWNIVWNTATQKNRTDIAAPDHDVVGNPWLPTAPDVRRYRESFDILTWDVEPGDVLAFQGNMLHGTDGHPGYNQPRRALAVLLGGPELRYHAPHGKAFPSPGRVRGTRLKDDIPDGAAIGDYEDAFPLCWQVDL